MKRIGLTGLLAAGLCMGVLAEEQRLTLKQYLTKAKVRRQKAGKPYNEAMETRYFRAKDTNDDGVWSPEEAKAKVAKGWNAAGGGLELEDLVGLELKPFLAKKKAAWEATGVPFNEAQETRFFNAKDTNKDGVWSLEEAKAKAPKDWNRK